VVAEIRLDFAYPYRPERLWTALTERRLLVAWLMENDFEAVRGHRFVLWPQGLPGLDGPITAVVLDLAAPRRLTLGWQNSSGQAVVTMDLRPTRRGSKLRLTLAGDLDPSLGATLRLLFGQRLPVVLAGVGASADPPPAPAVPPPGPSRAPSVGSSGLAAVGVGPSAGEGSEPVGSFAALPTAPRSSSAVPESPPDAAAAAAAASPPDVAVAAAAASPPDVAVAAAAASPASPPAGPSSARPRHRARIRLLVVVCVIIPAATIAGFVLLPDRWMPDGGSNGSGSGRLGGAPIGTVVQVGSGAPTPVPGQGASPSPGTTAAPGPAPTGPPGPPTPVTPEPQVGELKISYTATALVAGSLTDVDVDVGNTGDVVIEDWIVSFGLSGVNLAITNVKGATYTRRGPLYAFAPLPETLSVPPHGAVHFSFDVTGLLTKITSCTVNGAPC
jgi:uncharacterized protein YndB with AHSA1/START domain